MLLRLRAKGFARRGRISIEGRKRRFFVRPAVKRVQWPLLAPMQHPLRSIPIRQTFSFASESPLRRMLVRQSPLFILAALCLVLAILSPEFRQGKNMQQVAMRTCVVAIMFFQ